MLRAAMFPWARVAVPLGTLAIAAVACGEATLDAASAEAQIIAQLREAEGPAISSVECPEGIEVRAQATFACTATEPSGTTWTIEVTQLDEAGTLDYRVEPTPSP